MNAVAEYFASQRADAARWVACFAIVLIAHGVAVRAFLDSSETSDFDAGAPVVVLEIPEVAAAPAIPPNDLMPGPPEPETEPAPAPKEEIKPPETPADVALPTPEPPKPQPPVDEKPPTAKPSVEIPPSEAAPPAPGAAVQTPRLDVIRWQSALAAHIERFKRYPAQARSSGEQGVARVAFTIDRQGQLLASRIVQSSGSPTLDRETLAMLARAQPMPRPPGEVPDNKLSFVFPVRFNIR
ncbi:MAG: energy transducer TonB [Xanthobacteraceae bacterium]